MAWIAEIVLKRWELGLVLKTEIGGDEQKSEELKIVKTVPAIFSSGRDGICGSAGITVPRRRRRGRLEKCFVLAIDFFLFHCHVTREFVGIKIIITSFPAHLVDIFYIHH